MSLFAGVLCFLNQVINSKKNKNWLPTQANCEFIWVAAGWASDGTCWWWPSLTAPWLWRSLSCVSFSHDEMMWCQHRSRGPTAARRDQSSAWWLNLPGPNMNTTKIQLFWKIIAAICVAVWLQYFFGSMQLKPVTLSLKCYWAVLYECLKATKGVRP